MRRVTSRLAAAIALAAAVATAATAATATSATASPARPELGRYQAAPPTENTNQHVADWWF